MPEHLTPGPRIKPARREARAEPQTADDYIEEGAIDEESADRWLASDLAKSLRFYQRAFKSYTMAMGGTGGVTTDARYNAARLLFQVYNVFTTDGVSVDRLSNVADATARDGVVQSIGNVIEFHERAMGDEAPTDLLYNCALAYIEAIESDASNDVGRCQALVTEVLERQKLDFEEFWKSTVEGAEAESVSEPALEQLFIPVKTVQPPDIMDTVVAGYNLVTAVIERAPNEVQSVSSGLTPFVGLLETTAETILRFREGENPHSDLVASLPLEQLEEFALAQKYAEALSRASFEDVFALWEGDLPNLAPRFMRAADCVFSVLERIETTDEQYWGALTKAGQYLKSAQEILSKQFAARGQTLGAGTVISQHAKVYLARGDVELQRLQLPCEQATKNKELLHRNAVNFYKNALTVAKASGGLRETALEKAQRTARQHEATARLALLHGEPIPLDVWEEHVAELRDLWFFRTYFNHT